MSETVPPSIDDALAYKSAEADLCRALRRMLFAEYEAIRFFSQWAKSTANKTERHILHTLTHEERELVNELRKVLESVRS